MGLKYFSISFVSEEEGQAAFSTFQAGSCSPSVAQDSGHVLVDVQGGNVAINNSMERLQLPITLESFFFQLFHCVDIHYSLHYKFKRQVKCV